MSIKFVSPSTISLNNLVLNTEIELPVSTSAHVDTARILIGRIGRVVGVRPQKGFTSLEGITTLTETLCRGRGKGKMNLTSSVTICEKVPTFTAIKTT